MLLAIDIGNSFAKFGFFYAGQMTHFVRIPTTEIEFAEKLEKLFEESPDPVRLIIASVVPAATATIIAFANERGWPVKTATHELPFGLKLPYERPETLGIDRLIAAYAATERFGGPVIVASFGTATTIDAVDANRNFLGGTILPGLRTMAESLRSRTAKLPEVEIFPPASVFGKSTAESIRAGIFCGYLGIIREIHERMSRETGLKFKTVATGGFAQMIAGESNFIDHVADHLVLDGLALIDR